MIISLIVAMAENRVIGRENKIPWDLPEDRKLFKKITMGHPVIMGRKTFESIGKPLSGRKNIVLTRSGEYRPNGCSIVHSLEDALAEGAGADEVFIAGGGEVFREALPLASRIYLTVVHSKWEGDTFFPVIPDDFVEVEREEVADAKLPWSFVMYERMSEFNKPTVESPSDGKSPERH